jgi:uncharacterized protein YfaP (DUF2135 family)
MNPAARTSDTILHGLLGLPVLIRLPVLLGRLALLAFLATLAGSLPRAAADEASSPPLSVRIAAPRGGQTRERLVTIAGEVRGLTGDRLTLVLNGVALSIPRSGDAFSTPQVLAPGLNTLRVVAIEGTARAEDEVALYASVPGKDLRVTLTWDTPATDIDLWVTGPDGEKVFYQHKQGAAGGTLDTDVTTGYGPETYTQARAVPGTYRVQAHFYGGGVPTRVAVNVIRGEGSEEEERSAFRGVLLRPGDVVEVGEFAVSR